MDTPKDPRWSGYYGPAPVPPGSSSFEIELAGVRVRILDLPAAWDPFVVEQYGLFGEKVDLGRPAIDIRVKEGTGVIVPLPPPGGITVLDVQRPTPERLEVRSHYQHGWVDFARRQGELTITTRAWNGFTMSLENFLRVTFQLLLVERGRFLMHAAGLVDDGRAYVFFGPSGAGKSTATEFSAPRPALSDDLILIDASSDAPRAHAVPFFGAFSPKERARGAYPVAVGCRLRQAPDDRCSRLSPARAIATVSASVPFVHELGLPHEGLTDLVAQFCARVPIVDLHLTRGPKFWETLKHAGY